MYPESTGSLKRSGIMHDLGFHVQVSAKEIEQQMRVLMQDTRLT
jgi:hypothetical protein